MLQFIVLGLIPGTQIQITFGWLITAMLFSAAIVSVSVLGMRFIKSKLSTLKTLLLIQTSF